MIGQDLSHRLNVLLAERIGRRGAILVLLGVVWVLMGWAAVAAEPRTPDPSLGLFHLLIPPEIRFALWGGCGVVAAFTAVYPKGGRWQTIGFVALLLMPIERSLSYGIGWAVYLLPIQPPGYRLGWTAAIVWAAFAGIIMIIAGWAEPARLPPTGALAAAVREHSNNGEESAGDH